MGLRAISAPLVITVYRHRVDLFPALSTLSEQIPEALWNSTQLMAVQLVQAVSNVMPED